MYIHLIKACGPIPKVIHIYEYMDTPMALVDNKLNIQRLCADVLAHLNACTPSVRVTCFIERKDNMIK